MGWATIRLVGMECWGIDYDGMEWDSLFNVRCLASNSMYFKSRYSCSLHSSESVRKAMWSDGHSTAVDKILSYRSYSISVFEKCVI